MCSSRSGRTIAVVLTVCVCLIYFCLFSSAAYQITAGDSITVRVEPGEKTFIDFCPAVSGRYEFASEGKSDTYCTLYDSSMRPLAFNDDNGDTSNFSIVYDFQANTTYRFAVSHYLQSVALDVTVALTVLETEQSHLHNFSLYQKVDSTCSQEGQMIYRCMCGYKNTVFTQAAEHFFTRIVTKEPTCTKSGTCSMVCNVCGFSKTETLAALGHNYSKDFTTEKEPTCTAAGQKSRYCLRCSAKTEETVIPKLGHQPSGVYITEQKATCTAMGSAYMPCCRCDAKCETKKLPAKGHSYSSAWTVDKPSSLQSAGSKSHHCKRCSAKKDVTAIAKITSVTLSKTQYTYDAKAKKPVLTVKDSKGNKLKEGQAYTVTYPKNAKKTGTYCVTVKFKGNYSGIKTLKFSIYPKNTEKLTASQTQNSVSLKWSKVSGATKYRVYRYNSKTKKYTVVANTSKTSCTVKNLKAGTQYTFAVRTIKTKYGKDYLSLSYKQITTATVPKAVTLKGYGEYRTAKLSWSKSEGDGYIVYMYQPSTGKYEQAKKITKSTVTTHEKGNLARGKTYYFKVRAFKETENGVLFSPWSNTVSVKA